MQNPAQLEKLKNDLILDEGFRKFVYRDTENILTIGIGRNLEQKGISLPEARGLLQNDISEIWEDLVKNIPWIVTLDQVSQNVLMNVAFNVGVVGLLKFKNFLSALKQGNNKIAAAELLDSEAGRKLNRRYSRLSNEILTKKW